MRHFQHGNDKQKIFKKEIEKKSRLDKWAQNKKNF